MTDYISREAAIKRFNFAVLDCLGMEPTIRAGDIIKALETIPAADVRPVVRGHWIPTGQDEEFYGELNKCSVCGAVDIGFGDYCFNCGARMEGEE